MTGLLSADRRVEVGEVKNSPRVFHYKLSYFENVGGNELENIYFT